MTAQRPAPFVPAYVDLQHLPSMMVDVTVVRDSAFASNATADEFRAGFLLWCASWHQVPASSLPNDDRQLARMAGYGFAIEEWRKVKDGALFKFSLCSDGRLYHPHIAKKAVSAWNSTLVETWKRECDRIRKDNVDRKERGEPIVGKPPRPTPLSIGNIPTDPVERPDDGGGNPSEIAPKVKEGKVREDTPLPPTKIFGSGGTSEAAGAAPPAETSAQRFERLKAEAGADGQTKLAVELIDAFGRACQRIWRTDGQRIPKHRADLDTAKAWAAAGATLEIANDVFEAVLVAKHGRGEEEPKSMRYCDDPMKRAIADLTAKPGGGAGSGGPDPTREVAAEQHVRAITEWKEGGRKGPMPTLEDYLPKGAPAEATGVAA